MYDLIECDFHSIYGVDLGGYVMGSDGLPVWVMRARSARWFSWRLSAMVTDPSSRFHAVIDKRRQDNPPPAVPAPGEDEF